MNVSEYLDTPQGIAKIRDIVKTDPVSTGIVRSVSELKAKWSSIGSIPHGTVDSIVVNTPGFPPAVALPLIYSSVTNNWFSALETILNFDTAVARSTAAAAAVGTVVTVTQEAYRYVNFQSYLDCGLTAQMQMYATGQSDTATAFPIARFRAVKHTTNPVSVATPTPANLLDLNLVTAVATSSGILGATDVTVTGTGSHLWGDAVFAVGGAAAQISGYMCRVEMRWKA